MRENPVSHTHTLVIDGNLQIHHMAFDVYYDSNTAKTALIPH